MSNHNKALGWPNCGHGASGYIGRRTRGLCGTGYTVRAGCVMPLTRRKSTIVGSTVLVFGAFALEADLLSQVAMTVLRWRGCGDTFWSDRGFQSRNATRSL